MLEWVQLTNRQRTVCVCVSLLLAAGLAAELVSHQIGLSAVLESLGLALLLASALLNPALVRWRLSSFSECVKQVGISPIPATCKLLVFAAIGALLLSRLANLIG